MRPRRALVSLMRVLLLVMLCDSAHAQVDDATRQARTLFEKAEMHFSVGEFEKALDLYRQAYKTKPLPAFLFNIAQCHRHLGTWKRANFFYKRYLSQSPETPYRETVEGYIAECNRALVEQSKAKATPSPPSGRGGEHPRETRRSAAPPEPDTDRLSSPSSIWLWTGVAVSGALLATGAITGAIAYSKNQEFKDPATTGDRERALKDSGQKLAAASAVTLGLGGAGAVGTALYYFLVHRGQSRPATSVALSFDGAGLMVRGTF